MGRFGSSGGALKLLMQLLCVCWRCSAVIQTCFSRQRMCSRYLTVISRRRMYFNSKMAEQANMRPNEGFATAAIPVTSTTTLALHLNGKVLQPSENVPSHAPCSDLRYLPFSCLLGRIGTQAIRYSTTLLHCQTRIRAMPDMIRHPTLPAIKTEKRKRGRFRRQRASIAPMCASAFGMRTLGRNEQTREDVSHPVFFSKSRDRERAGERWVTNGSVSDLGEEMGDEFGCVCVCGWVDLGLGVAVGF